MTLTATISERNPRFDALMRGSYKKVYNLAYRLSGSRNDAEDLTQEAFFRAYRSFQDYEGDRPFENWIFRIVTRLFLDLVRSRKRRVQAVSYDATVRPDGTDDDLSIQTPDKKPNPEQTLLQQTLSEDLEYALSQLKAEQRTLVMLADVEGLPYSEIAQIAQIPVGTVRSRLHRAHKKLREAIESRRTGAKAVKGKTNLRVVRPCGCQELCLQCA